MNIKAENLDYLVVGHITQDLLPDGTSITGGTVTYAAVCARNLGYKAGILTSSDPNQTFPELDGFSLYIKPSQSTTTFENIQTDSGRQQILHKVASPLSAQDIPENIKHPRIVHLGPLTNEIKLDLLYAFPDSFIGVTPQGFMRQRSEGNIVNFKEWENAEKYLKRADAVVLSIEDVGGNMRLIDDYASKTDILVLTEGYLGASVYWHGDIRHFSAPKVPVIDPTGAGDIFAAVFFTAFHHSKDPWLAAKKAVSIASASVSRVGIKGVPTPKEMRSFQIEIIEGK